MRKQRQLKEKYLTARDEFMMTEYDRIKDMLIYASEMGHNRVQFFVSVLSAVGAVILVLFQTQGMSERFVLVLMIFDLGLVVLGTMLFTRLTRRVISKIQYFRALAKIRRYFVNQNSEIEKYLYYSTYDDKPSFRYDNNPTFSSLRLTISMLNSFLWTVLGLCLLFFVMNGEISWWHYINTGIIVFAISLLIHELISKRDFGIAEKMYDEKIGFPSGDKEVRAKHRKTKKRKIGPIKIKVQKVKSKK